MSYESGISALNMIFTEKVPRTEYSAHFHWLLVKRVTGIDTDNLENRKTAGSKFIQAWDYAFLWRTYVKGNFLEKNGRVTKMGHAVYSENSEGKADFSEIIANPFEDTEEALALDPFSEYGEFDQGELVNEFNRVYYEVCHEVSGTLNMGGVYITLFSGLIEMYGWETLLTLMGSYKKELGKIIESYYQWVKQLFDAYAKSDVPVIMSHDDLCWTSGPVAHPDWYREYIFPYIKKLWEPLKESGKKIIFTSDGDYTEFFDDIVQCGADMLVMEPSSDMRLFAEKYGKTHGFVGNADTS